MSQDKKMVVELSDKTASTAKEKPFTFEQKKLFSMNLVKHLRETHFMNRLMPNRQTPGPAFPRRQILVDDKMLNDGIENRWDDLDKILGIQPKEPAADFANPASTASAPAPGPSD